LLFQFSCSHSDCNNPKRRLCPFDQIYNVCVAEQSGTGFEEKRFHCPMQSNDNHQKYATKLLFYRKPVILYKYPSGLPIPYTVSYERTQFDLAGVSGNIPVGIAVARQRYTQSSSNTEVQRQRETTTTTVSMPEVVHQSPMQTMGKHTQFHNIIKNCIIIYQWRV